MHKHWKSEAIEKYRKIEKRMCMRAWPPKRERVKEKERKKRNGAKNSRRKEWMRKKLAVGKRQRVENIRIHEHEPEQESEREKKLITIAHYKQQNRSCAWCFASLKLSLDCGVNYLWELVKLEHVLLFFNEELYWTCIDATVDGEQNKEQNKANRTREHCEHKRKKCMCSPCTVHNGFVGTMITMLLHLFCALLSLARICLFDFFCVCVWLAHR